LFEEFTYFGFFLYGFFFGVLLCMRHQTSQEPRATHLELGVLRTTQFLIGGVPDYDLYLMPKHDDLYGKRKPVSCGSFDDDYMNNA
jgi:hypothetical protein